MTNDEIIARDSEHWIGIRRVRDELLAECDWRACSDRTMSENWKTYRQALRDITTQSDPYNITWPTIPAKYADRRLKEKNVDIVARFL